MALTKDDLNKCHVVCCAHYNMGKRGYGYGYQFVEIPRLSYTNRTYRPCHEHPDGLRETTYYVDGDPVKDIDAAVAALCSPPSLTDDERRVLALIPTEFVDLIEIEDELAGVPRPSGGIMPDTPHSRVSKWLSVLKSKGMIEYGDGPTVRRRDCEFTNGGK